MRYLINVENEAKRSQFVIVTFCSKTRQLVLFSIMNE